MINKSGMFRITAIAIFPALIFLASCEMPESVRLKASPTLQIPIPLKNGVDNGFIRDYVTVAAIEKKLSGVSDQLSIRVYEYAADNTFMDTFGIDRNPGEQPVQTYLVTYPFFDMSLDLQKYINGTPLDENAPSRVPPLVIPPGISGAYTFPPLEVDLGSMKNLLSNVTFYSTGFALDAGDDPEGLKNALRVWIPQLKIGDENYSEQGVLVDGKLVFSGADIYPNEPLLLTGTSSVSEKISIYIKLLAGVSAGTYGSEIDFNWNTVRVSPPANNKLEGEFQFGSYLNDLGGAQFAAIPAYLYMDTKAITGLDVKITTSGGSIEWPSNSPKDAYRINSSSGWKPPSGLDISNPHGKYDFATIVNGDGNQVLKYSVSTPSVILSSNDIDNDMRISATLAVLLPMAFVFPTGERIAIGDTNYLPIKFEALDNFLGESSNSTLAEIDEQLGGNMPKKISLRITDIENNITSPIYLAIATNKAETEWAVVAIDASDSITPGNPKVIELLDPDSLAKLPAVKFLIKDEGYGGRFYIQSQEAGDLLFSLKLSVVAEIDLDKKVEF
jgi:hypothetical protein